MVLRTRGAAAVAPVSMNGKSEKSATNAANGGTGIFMRNRKYTSAVPGCIKMSRIRVSNLDQRRVVEFV